MLSLNGVKAVEVEEDELGIPVTASYHVRVPPKHNAVFEVNIHAETQGMQVIMGNKHLLEKHPNMYQHELAILAEENSEKFPLMAITNLDHVKTLHLAKGEVVGFARPKSSDVTYIATTNELNIEEAIDVMPRNWIPQQKWNLQSQALQQPQATHSDFRELSQKSRPFPEIPKTQVVRTPRNDTTSTFQESKCKSGEHSQNSRLQSAVMGTDLLQHANDSFRKREFGEYSQNSLNQQWCELSEVIESDFLISPGDVYPNRKVELEDTDIKDSTRVSFEVLCEQQHEAFSKNKGYRPYSTNRNGNQYRGQFTSSTVTLHFALKTLRLGTPGNRNFGKIWCN